MLIDTVKVWNVLHFLLKVEPQRTNKIDTIFLRVLKDFALFIFDSHMIICTPALYNFTKCPSYIFLCLYFRKHKKTCLFPTLFIVVKDDIWHNKLLNKKSMTYPDDNNNVLSIILPNQFYLSTTALVTRIAKVP